MFLAGRGHDVRDVTQDSLGSNIAMVLQEPFLFTGTVLENIRYRCGEKLDDVVSAAKTVGHGSVWSWWMTARSR